MKMPVIRPALFSIVKLLYLALANLPFIRAAPLAAPAVILMEGKDAQEPALWLYLGTAIALVLLGGAFAGLTIA